MAKSAAVKKQNLSITEYDRTQWKEDGTPKTGWTAFPHEFWGQISRLRSGAVQGDLLCYCVRLTFGLEPDRREKDWPEWTPWVRWDDFAEEFRCTVRAVQDVAKEAMNRAGGPVIAMQERRAEVRFRLLWRTWAKLPDFEDVPRPIPVPDTPQAEAVPMFEKPFAVRAGRKRRVKVFDGEISLEPKTDTEFQLYQLSEKVVRLETHGLKDGEKTGSVETSPFRNQSDTKNNRNYSSDSFAESSPEQEANTVLADERKVSLPELIVKACAEYGLVSDDVILQLLANCQSFAPECTLDEIAAEVRRVGGSVKDRRQAAGAIIKSVPKYFASSAYRQGIKPATSAEYVDEKHRRMVEKLRRLRGHVYKSL